MYWSEALRIARSAKNLANGKPLQNNTRLMLHGPKEEPTCIAVKYHRTEIVRYYPDGSFEIATGWGSITTRERIRNYSGVVVCTMPLPSINRSRPSVERAMFLHYAHQEVPFNSVGGYIRIDPSGHIDMSTVEPHRVTIISNLPEVNKKSRHMHRLKKLVLGYMKLRNSTDFLISGEIPTDQWLYQRLDTPIEEVALSPFPRIFMPYGRDPRVVVERDFNSTILDIKWKIARNNGWTGPAAVWHSRGWKT